MKRVVNVHMIPTLSDNPTTVPFLKMVQKNRLVRHAAGGEFRKYTSMGFKPQHLYLTLPEPIKLFSDVHENQPLLFLSANGNMKEITTKKARIKTIGEYFIIVSTSNPDYYPKNLGDIAKLLISKVHAAFLATFFTEYNNGNVLKEVKVDFTQTSCGGNINYSHHDTENCSPEDADEVFECDRCGKETRNPGYNWGKQRICHSNSLSVTMNDKLEAIIYHDIAPAYTNEEWYMHMQYYMEYCKANAYVTPQTWLTKHKHY